MVENDKPGHADLVRACARPGRLRDAIVDLWRRVRIDWSIARSGLAAAIREHGLGSRERRFARAVVFGLIRHARRVDEAIAAGSPRGRGGRGAPARDARDADAARVLALLVLEAGLTPDEATRALPAGPDFTAVAAIDAKLARRKPAAARIARAHSLPDWLARALVADHGDDAEPLAAALNRRAPTTLRVNTLRTTRDALADELVRAGVPTRPGRWCETALVVAGDHGGAGEADLASGHVWSDRDRGGMVGQLPGRLTDLDAFRRGAFELQDEGSQLVAELVAARPGELVVDVCAGAGGKTLALAAAMANRGRLVAADIDARKISELRRRARRAGVDTVRGVVVVREPDTGAAPRALERFTGEAARVVIDAPCTGTGALRRQPEHKWRLVAGDALRHARDQIAIATGAADLLAPGGRLVYATCSLLAAENLAVVRALCARRPDLAPVPLARVLGAERAAALRGARGEGGEVGEVGEVGEGEAAGADAALAGATLALSPHRHDTDGFFALVLERAG